MKAYDGNHTIITPKRIFNYRVCRGRRVVENVFGQLANKFQIFHKPIELIPEKASIVTLASIHLFNYIKRTGALPQNEYDTENNEGEVIPGEWRSNPHESCLVNIAREDNNTTSDPDAISTTEDTRMELIQYFLSNVGRLEWQYNQ